MVLWCYVLRQDSTHDLSTWTKGYRWKRQFQKLLTVANLHQLSVQLIKPNYLLLIKGKLADIFREYKHFSLNVSYPAFLFLIINYYSTHFHSFIYSFFTHLSVFFHLLFHLLQDIRAGTFQHELGISRQPASLMRTSEKYFILEDTQNRLQYYHKHLEPLW